MWHKEVRWHHVESDIFWKKVQGQKHPGRWGIVEHQIPSIKVLFKTNAKSHKHPGIKILSSESKKQLVNQRKQNSYRRAYIYIYILTQSFWTGTKVIRRKHIIQPTGFSACSSTSLSMGWIGCASTMGVMIKLPPSCSSPKIMCQSIHIVWWWNIAQSQLWLIICLPTQMSLY